MEQWKQILRNSSNTDEVSIIDADVTGIKGSQIAPDGVFYTEFSEDEARAYHTIFSNFAKEYACSPNMSIARLEDMLYRQNSAVKRRFCPIELILYTSRCTGDIIANDDKVFYLLKKIIGQLFDEDAMKIAQYILGGWEWKTQLSVFVEAIGVACPELVSTAMLYFPQLAELCADDDKALLKSYINMLVSTQDEAFADYFVDVVTNELFMADNDAIEHFFNKLNRYTYWRVEERMRAILEAIEGEDITPVLKRRISGVKRKFEKSASRTGYVNVGDMNFTFNSEEDFFVWERENDAGNLAKINSLVMENIDDITSDEFRGRAYITLATQGKKQRDTIREFLLRQREEYPKFEFSINVALFHLKSINLREADKVFNLLFSENYRDFYSKNLAKYLRYKTDVMSGVFLSFLSNYFENSLEEAQLSRSLAILYSVLEQFNANDGKLAGVAAGIMKILLRFEGDFDYSSTYNNFMDLFDIIVKVRPANKNDVLNMLDKFKYHVSKKEDMLSVGFRIDNSIKKLDSIVAPTGN